MHEKSDDHEIRGVSRFGKTIESYEVFMEYVELNGFYYLFISLVFQQKHQPSKNQIMFS